MNETSTTRFDWEVAKQKLDELRASLEGNEEISKEQETRILRMRAAELAKIPESPPSTDEVMEVVQFQLGGESYAVETRFVFELTRVGMITPLPQTHPHFLGVTNLRGDVTTIVDLAQYLGVPGTGQPLSQIIVLGRRQPEIGAAVAEVGDVTVLRRDELSESINVVGAHRDLVMGCNRDGLLVFDGEELLQCESLYVEQTD